MKTTPSLLAAALSGALGLGLFGCGSSHEAKAGAAPPTPVNVTTTAASLADLPDAYEATGTVRARTSTTLSAKWMGYVREMRVSVGDRVREGQTLVTLDSRDLDASSNRASAARDEVRNGIPEADSAVASAKANFDLAQATFRRMKDLYDKKSISDQEFDEASAKIKAAQAAYDMAKARRTQIDSRLAQADQEVNAAKVTRSYAEIQSPFSGIVTAKMAEPGTLAVPGAPLLTIERDGYRLEVSVDESKLGVVKAGMPVTVSLDGVDRSIDSRVGEIVPSIDSASRSVTAKVDLPSIPLVRSGMFGRAAFRLGSHRVLTVPAASVRERGQIQSVFVAGDGVARLRLVTLGSKQGDAIEVLSGLNEGEKVVSPIPQNLADGSPVEVRP
ncbi:MAG: efflux RND transporter periplasmic adaptor subunit [Acidobacteriota bacterium]|nr:efflux RND transporter periplasmic adaptor subunit [Acidobacteriota bacterium]